MISVYELSLSITTLEYGIVDINVRLNWPINLSDLSDFLEHGHQV